MSRFFYRILENLVSNFILPRGNETSTRIKPRLLSLGSSNSRFSLTSARFPFVLQPFAAHTGRLSVLINCDPFPLSRRTHFPGKNRRIKKLRRAKTLLRPGIPRGQIIGSDYERARKFYWNGGPTKTNWNTSILGMGKDKFEFRGFSDMWSI